MSLPSFEQPRSPAPDADALGVPAVVTLPQMIKRQPVPAGVFHHSFLAFAAAVFELRVNQSSTKTRSRSRRTVPLRLACVFLLVLFGFGQGLTSQAVETRDRLQCILVPTANLALRLVHQELTAGLMALVNLGDPCESLFKQ